MSFAALMWATRSAPVADVNEFAILTVLAEKADSDGCNAFPARATIATRACLEITTVKRRLDSLTERGLLAEGNQRAAEYLRADRRPVVYDLLIPYSWFPDIESINEEREERGLPPLTPENRPDIPPPPRKTRRSDLGKKRPKKERGVSEPLREAEHGGAISPERGGYQSGTGGLQAPRTSPITQPLIPPPTPSVPRHSTEAAKTGGEEKPREEKPNDTALLVINALPTQLRPPTKDHASLADALQPFLIADWSAAALVKELTTAAPDHVHSRTGFLIARLRQLDPKRTAPIPRPRELCPQHPGRLMPCGTCRSDQAAGATAGPPLPLEVGLSLAKDILRAKDKNIPKTPVVSPQSPPALLL